MPFVMVSLVASRSASQYVPEKIGAKKSMPFRQNIKELRQFLGLTGYYRNHINHYGIIPHTLTALIIKDKPYSWTEKHQNALIVFKGCLQKLLIILHSNPRKPSFPVAE